MSSNKKKKKIFVLMLENRSLDHLLGRSSLNGQRIDGSPAMIDGLLTPAGNSRGYFNIPSVGIDKGLPFDPSVTPLTDPLHYDPPHEFCDVLMQLCGVGATQPRNGGYPIINNSGFIDSYSGLLPYSDIYNCCHRNWFFSKKCSNHNNHPATPGDIMGCFPSGAVPALYTLAKEFAVCDRWFSSLPGPTWPNRYFAHAASSAGLDDSPDKLKMITAYASGQGFQNGTLFDRLNEKKLPWEIFTGDHLPQSFALKGMTHEWLVNKRFTPFTGTDGKPGFKERLEDPNYEPAYVFIEPNWGKLFGKQSFAGGNSQHPVDGIAGGERLIRDVYSAIRNSPHWEHSMLIITYDEHGGFYDHCIPPSARPPGDITMPTDNNKHGFDFTVLGVRVPTVVVSPWIRENTIDDTLYDHSSIPATVMRLFNLREPLTNRDRNANDLLALIGTEPNLRNNTPVDIPYAKPKEDQALDQDTEELSGKPINPITRGFLNIAHRKHHAIESHNIDHDRFLDTLRDSYGNPELFAPRLSEQVIKRKQEIAAEFEGILDEKNARDYINRVIQLCDKHLETFPQFYGGKKTI